MSLLTEQARPAHGLELHANSIAIDARILATRGSNTWSLMDERGQLRDIEFFQKSKAKQLWKFVNAEILTDDFLQARHGFVALHTGDGVGLERSSHQGKQARSRAYGYDRYWT